MGWLMKQKPRQKCIEMTPVDFWEKLMKLKVKLHVVKDPHFLFIWFEAGPFYCTKLTLGSWLSESLERNFPDKMGKVSGHNDPSRWQTISRKELKLLN